MLINNYEKLFLWKTNDKILAFLIKHAHTHTHNRTANNWVRNGDGKYIHEGERVASSAQTNDTTITADGWRRRNKFLMSLTVVVVVSVIIIVVESAHTQCQCAHAAQFFHISTVCTSFSTIFSLFSFVSLSSPFFVCIIFKVSLNCLA